MASENNRSRWILRAIALINYHKDSDMFKEGELEGGHYPRKQWESISYLLQNIKPMPAVNNIETTTN